MPSLRFASLVLAAFAIVVPAGRSAFAQLGCGEFEASLAQPPGVNGTVRALVAFDESGGRESLFLGGDFSAAGGVSARHVARWDGSEWSSVGPGLDGAVLALLVFDDGSGPVLVAGGSFRRAGSTVVEHVAKWDGISWSALGAGLEAVVTSLAVHDDSSGPTLFAGGESLGGGGTVDRWTGSEWVALGRDFDAPVRALASFDDGARRSLCAGGAFLSNGTDAVSRVAAFDGARWRSLGVGVDGEVLALASFDDGSGPALVVGGRFSRAGGVSSPLVAKWLGNRWVRMGIELRQPNDFVAAISVVTTCGAPAVHVGGSFRLGGTRPGLGVACFHSGHWGAVFLFDIRLGTESVLALTEWDDGEGSSLVAGGSFLTWGGDRLRLRRVMRMSSEGVESLGSGPDNAVLTAAAFDDGSGPAIFVGGFFTRPSRGIARWDSNGLSRLSSEPGGFVTALATFDDGSGPALFAASQTRGVVRWDGARWAEIGGFDAVADFAVFDDGRGAALFAAGNDVLRWDGRAWEPISLPVGQSAEALAVFDDGNGPALYAGGRLADGGMIARRDGDVWTLVGKTNGPVLDLAVHDSGIGPSLFAGGAFSRVGSTRVAAISRWDGRNWSVVSGGLNGAVHALASYDAGTGAVLVAAGDFDNAGGVPVARIARWDGVRWSRMSSGLDGTPESLAAVETVDGPAIVVGGRFRRAGDVRSAFVARWTDPCASAIRGTVGAGDLSPADVLFVNDSAGGRDRRLAVTSSEPLTISVAAAPGPAGRSRYALYGWPGEPTNEDVRRLPFGVGSSAMPMPPVGGEPAPRLVLNNTGRAALGAPTFPSSPAPSIALRLPRGTRRPITFFVQGIIADPASAGTVAGSVTNGVIVDAR